MLHALKGKEITQIHKFKLKKIAISNKHNIE